MSTPSTDPSADAPSSPAKKNQDAVERALDAMKPMVQKLSLGGIMGYCSGMALKKVGKAMAFVVGLGFVAVQSAAYAGYITVNWKQVANDAIVKPIDSTGDGKIDMDDVKVWWKKLRKMLTHQLPDATGFSMGFMFGVRYG